LKTYTFSGDKKYTKFSDDISIPLRPSPGVRGVAADTDEMLSTVPQRANGGNLDDPNIVEGTTVYFPVFVEGALFSIGATTRRAGPRRGERNRHRGADAHRLQSEDDRRDWTNPLRGSSPTERSPVVRAFSLLHPVIALPGYAPLHTPGWASRRCRGGSDDPASATHARGHAGSESLAAHATRLHSRTSPASHGTSGVRQRTWARRRFAPTRSI
jgi:hypothetical protein